MATVLSGPRVPVEADQVAALLRELVAEVRGLRADLTRDRRPSRLTRHDRDRLVAILPAAGGVFGSELFTAKELLEHDAAALRLVLRGLTARQLGRLLQRAEGAVLGGYTVQRDGVKVGAVLWRVLATTP
jgi:hypothetical protein